jgi:hypothetical protein
VVQAEDAVGAGPRDRSRRGHDGGQIACVPERLGAHDHSRDAAGRGTRGIRGGRHAGVEPDRQPEPGDRLDDRAVVAGAGDRVEVRDVAGVGAEALAEGPGERDRIRRVGQHAPHRGVGVTLAAHRVHRHAALEIQHRHDTHRGRG